MGADVGVVGSGPNGLAAAVTMARAGLSVEVLERNAWIGGGCATRELTLPGFRHDVASAVHPMALASPFFRAFELERRITLDVPEVSYAHPLPDGRTALAYRDLDRTAEHLGVDGPAYRALMAPLVEHVDALTDLTGGPLLRVPDHPWPALRFAAAVAEQGTPAWGLRWRDDLAPALVAGTAAHTIGRQPRLSTAGGGLLLGAHAHARGWPVPRGGSQAIVEALADDLRAHGGVIRTGVEVTEAGQLDGYRTVLLDVSAPALERIAGDRLPSRYRRALLGLRPGSGVSKLDLALAGPVPWTDPAVGRAPTVHLGGTRSQVAGAEGTLAAGGLSDDPYVLLVQPGVIDPTRAPEGAQTLWAYTHVPFGSTVDRSEAILDVIERHAPGVRDLILARHSTPASRLGEVSPNFTGGDFATGAVTLWGLLRRPVISPQPWRTPVPGWYLASSATPPGPAVHGLAGWQAALLALREQHGLPAPGLGAV